MWLDLWKGVFHTHPIYQLWWFITLDWYKLLTWNLVSSKCQHSLMAGRNFSSIFYSTAKLWSSKFRELDVCGRPLFANPFTFWHPQPFYYYFVLYNYFVLFSVYVVRILKQVFMTNTYHIRLFNLLIALATQIILLGGINTRWLAWDAWIQLI